MKKLFETPVLTILPLTQADVLTLSGSTQDYNDDVEICFSDLFY